MEMLAFHKQLIALRHACPALRTGRFVRLYADEDCVAFARVGDGATIIVAVNVAEGPRTIAVPLGDLLPDGTALAALYGAGAAQVAAGQLAVQLPARDGVVLA